MDLALYDSVSGYYARAARRSGRAGDFFTSVDVGPLFGELIAVQLAEMFELLEQSSVASRKSSVAGRKSSVASRESSVASRESSVASRKSSVASRESSVASRRSPFDLVEAGAGDARLSADILRAARERQGAFYGAVRLHLVEASAPARAAQCDRLGDVGDRLASSGAELPASFEGVLIANELLDAMPTHQVVMRDDGLKEIYVSHQSQVASRQSRVASRQSRPTGLTTRDLRLTTAEGPPSTPALQQYLDRLGVTLEAGWRAEINLAAVEWVREAARRLTRGFMILIDYGHEARELYSASHSAGTLTSFSRHRGAGAESSTDCPPWLVDPGERDITAHVDFTSVRAAAEAEGMDTIAFLDQTYFLMGLLDALPDPQSAIRNPQLKTLIVPGGLGSTLKVLILGKGVGKPALKGCSFKVRAT